MIDILDVVKNLKRIKKVKQEEMQDKIISAFEGYTFNNISEVKTITPSIDNQFKCRAGNHYCCINDFNSPLIHIKIIENEDKTFSIIDVNYI